jgi:hypothetical protein
MVKTTSFSWLPDMFVSNGFPEVQPSQIVSKDFPDWQAMGLTPNKVEKDEYRTSDIWHANLLCWLAASIDVLAQVTNDEIHVYHGVVESLAKYFSELLKTSESDVFQSLVRIATMHGMAQYCLEQLVFNVEGGWILRKHRGPYGSGQLDKFYGWTLYSFSQNNEIDRAVLHQIFRTAMYNCDIEDLKGRPRKEVFESFVTYFLSLRPTLN